MQQQEAHAKVRQLILDGLKRIHDNRKIKARSRYLVPKEEHVVLRRNESVMARESRNVRQ